jgi:homoserine O-succinyltransferase/O-acetyltransferase
MLTIGMVNNMPPAAIRSTERQFREILAAAAGDEITFELRWFRLSGARPEHYGRPEELWDQDFDGIIVTGAEPRTEALQDESLWRPLTMTIDWAASHTSSAIWSCLAAHAAVLHLDGIKRHTREEKIFGVFDSVRSADHAIFANTQPNWRVPHSRWNDIPETELEARGYTILARSQAAGVDTFVKQIERSLFVFMQSHPEYDANSLKREYHRDIARFHGGLRDQFPAIPRNYFDSDIAAELEALRDDPTNHERSYELLDPVEPENSWRPMTIQLYRNWLFYMMRHVRTPESVSQ